MNVTFVFFLVICILIIAFSVFTTLGQDDQEGFDTNQWDVDGMVKVINDLNSQGINYQVNNYSDHIDMLVNRFNVLNEKVTIELTGPAADFPGLDDGQCYRDYPGRELPYGYGMPATWVGWEWKRRWWWWWREPKYRYVHQNNYNNCKNRANQNGHNTFGLQWGQECWTGNTSNDMVNDKGRQLQKIDDRSCNKGGINDDETGGGWSNMVYKKITTKTVNRITNYEKIIREFVKSNLHNDSDVKNAQNFNLSGFTTMEGFDNEYVNGIPVTGRYIKATDKITVTDKNSQNVNIATNNIIDTIVNNNYKVQTLNFTEFVDKFKKPGKSITDLNKYIQTMKSIGIDSETLANKLVERLKPYCSNGNEPFHDIMKLITVYFKKYGIDNVSAIFDAVSPREEDGWFIQIVKSHQLHTLSLPLLPSTVGNAPADSIMEKLYTVNSSIQTIGITNMSSFFSNFNAYGVNGSSFFNNIYPIYSDTNLKIYNYIATGSVDPLSDALYKINGLSNSGLISGFQTLKSLLGELKLNFNEYVNFTIQLKSRVSYTDIITVWNDFKTYYTTIAYPSPASPPNQNVTPTILISWIDEINRTATSGTYFSNDSGDFDTFLKILIEGKYTTSRFKNDVSIGQTYDEFMSMHPTPTTPPAPSQSQQQNFSNMTYNNDNMDIFQTLERWFLYMLGMNRYTENMESSGMSASDKSILNNFGITDFNEQLLSVENKLRQYGVRDMDSSQTEWKNIVNVIHKLTLTKITINELDDFVKLMDEFGAKSIKEWYDVLDKLTQIKIESYDNVKTFITEITKFGVIYKENFDLFIQYLKIFKSDFSSGNLIPVITFMNDMKKTQNTYQTNQGTVVVNNIIQYFTNYNFTLMLYYSGSSFSIIKCDQIIPKNFPSLLVNSLYDYGTKGSYGNNLYDIQANHNSQTLFEACDIVNAMHEAYMIANSKGEYNGHTALIDPNVTIISSFFYKEEMDAILNKPNHYSSHIKRVLIINDIADGMVRYSEVFKVDRKQDYELYNNIAKLLKIIPAVAFQYLSNEFISKCDGKDCWYTVYVDPVYSECKASTSNKTINYRPKPPVM
jgi:hypothetical protein